MDIHETVWCEVQYFLKCNFPSSPSFRCFYSTLPKTLNQKNITQFTTIYRHHSKIKSRMLQPIFCISLSNFSILFNPLSPPLISICMPYPLSTTFSYFVLIYAGSSLTWKPVPPLIALDILIRNIPLLTHRPSLPLFTCIHK